jgi:hypothetical protein
MATASHHRALETQLDNETVLRQTITFTKRAAGFLVVVVAAEDLLPPSV